MLARKSEMMPKFDDMADKWHLGGVEMIDPEVRVFGDVALLTYRENVTGAYEGEPVKYTGKATMIYVRQNGSWRGVHYHESK